MDRDWVGFDANQYRERGGQFEINQEGGWGNVDLPPSQAFKRELISQYFGGIVRAEAPPGSIGEAVGFHVIAIKNPGVAPVWKGIVGQWDMGLARTGHALGSGPPSARQNQYGDGIYVVNPDQNPRDYQSFEDESIVYEVYRMRWHHYASKGDQQQTVFNDPSQIELFCFVEVRRLPSVRSEREKTKPIEQFEQPDVWTGKGPPPINNDGKLNYSIF